MVFFAITLFFQANCLERQCYDKNHNKPWILFRKLLSDFTSHFEQEVYNLLHF